MTDSIRYGETEFAYQDKWGKTTRDILRELLAEQGITEYAVSGSSTEGGKLPTDLETTSWSVLTPDGRLWDYFLDWNPEKLNPDKEKGYYEFREPREQDPGGYQETPEHLHALRELGLPLTEEQERILREWEAEHKSH